MKELNINLSKIYGTDSFDSKNVITEIKDIAHGLKYSSVNIDESRIMTKNFIERYNNEYSTEPSIYAFDAYAAMQYLIQSAEICGTNTEQIKTCLENQHFQTIRGNESFNQQHDMNTSIKLFEL